MTNYFSHNLPHQVWAYYHPFYGTPDGPTGRWLTWNEPLWLATGYGYDAFQVPDAVREKLKHDPDQFLAPGRRANYSAFYPILGLYDCLDPASLEKQACWALEASLDGLIWDYMLVGEDNSDKLKPLQETIYDRSFRVMLNVLERNRMSLELSPWYDSFGWYNYPVEKIAEDLGYMARTYFHHPKVLHIDGRLVIYIYSTFARHSVKDWQRVVSLLAQDNLDRTIFLVSGEVAQQMPDLTSPGLFNGFNQYNYDIKDWSAAGVTHFSSLMSKLAERNGTPFWAATVGPGFDGRNWHHPGRDVARGLGKLYEDMWAAAIAAQPPFITICSFNEWGEGTQIEPCLEYEDLYLKLTAKWAQAFKQKGNSI
jgi:glycoprotein endo-alpha-1,2-mannosidase